MSERKAPLFTGPVLMAGHHEPLIFRRRGGRVTDGLEGYQYEHSRENAQALALMGVNWVRVHYFKGFGLKIEAEEMEMARQWIAILHEHGIKVESYLQFSNTMYETFLVERPEAKDWVQITQEGAPTRLCYGHQTWRFMMCHNNADWENYLKAVIKKAVLEAGVDMLAWDNYAVGITPDFCHCKTCEQKFREFVEKRHLNDREKINRYGFSDFSRVIPPVYNRFNNVMLLKTIQDPLIQDWIDFVACSKAEALGRLNDYGRSLKNDLTVNCNGIMGPAEDLVFNRGIDVAAISKTCHIIGSEEHHYPHLWKDGTLVTRIRTSKRCNAFGSAAFNYPNNDDRNLRVQPLALAETAAFDLVPHCFAGITARKSEDEKWQYWDFINENKELFGRRQGLARIAILRGNAAMRYNREATYIYAIQCEQILIQNHYIFDMLEDEQLADLARYKVLILPHTESIGAKEADLIRAFIEKGGKVLAVGATGVFDQWRRPLSKPRFADMMPDKDFKGKSWQKSIGKGRFAHIPELLLRKKITLEDGYEMLILPETVFSLPKNEAAVVKAINSFGRDINGIRLKAPKSVAVEWWHQENGSAYTVHIINYNVARKLKNAEIELADGQKPKEIIQLAPGKKPRKLCLSKRGSLSFIKVPEVDLYAVIKYSV